MKLNPYEQRLINKMVASNEWRTRVVGGAPAPNYRQSYPGWLRFDGSSVGGIQDGQHIYNHGDKYPVFARVKGGVLYAVGIDLSPTQNYCDASNNCDYVRTNPLYMKPVKLGRAWLTTTLGSYGNLFADMPHQSDDFDFPASIYLEARASQTSNWKAAAVGGSGAVTPVTPTPTNPSPGNPSPANPTPVPVTPSPVTPSPVSTPAAALSLNDYLLWGGIGLGGILLLILVIIFIRR